MDNSSAFLHELYSPGGTQGLAALKNAPNTHPNEWANRNPYTMVSMLKHAWSVNFPSLGSWVVEHIPSPVSNFPYLLSESFKHENNHVSDFLLAEFDKFTNQKIDEPKAQRIGLSAALSAAECGKIEYLKKTIQIMRNYFLCDHLESIAGAGAAYTDVVQHLWDQLSELGKINVAREVVYANNTDMIEWVAQHISSSDWTDVECNLNDDQKNTWRAHTTVIQRACLEDHIQTGARNAPVKKI